MNEIKVDLGFLASCEPWLLTNKFFPSKVGGRPAWLNLETVPSADRLKCNECNNPRTFLCQIYAPIDQFERCFHRTLHVFICTNAECWKPNISSPIKVFRCQLPRENKFYDSKPSSEDTPSNEIPSPIKLCQVCGCRGPLSCGNCKSVNYCSAAHQKIDWTRGEHKINCKSNSTSKIGNEKHKHLLEEFELDIEPEDFDEETSKKDVDDEAQRMKDYEEYIEKNKDKTGDIDLSNVPAEEFEKYMEQVDDDKVFHAFKERIEIDPQQVIRFSRGGKPLWITNKTTFTEDKVPMCELCHGPRVFEFQIMPQLLNSYSDLNVDWGVIAIFTCKDSCDTNEKYVDEFC